MIRSLLLSLVAAIALHPSPIVGQESETTTWEGTLDAGGTLLRLKIDITGKAGKLTGTLCSLDQNNTTMEMSEINVDGDGLSFSIDRIGASFRGKFQENGEVAEGTFVQGGARLPLTLSRVDTPMPREHLGQHRKPDETLREAWVGKLEMGLMEPVMQFRIITNDSGETTAKFDSITEGLTGFEATWSIEGDKIEFDVAKIRLTYRGTLNNEGDQAEGTWSQGGRDLPLVLKKQPTEYDTVNVWENRPQRPVEPFPYDSGEVTFKNEIDDVTLAGTLTLPRSPGKHAVVVLISGSGAQDRDESIMEHKPFMVLADYLTRRGIAVLRYDDRGTAKSTGNFGTATTEDFARDASAAVEFLKGHSRINPLEIGLAGHSEGGLVAPMVVGLRDDVAFVVLLAATGVTGETIMLSQTEAMLRASNVDEERIRIALAVNGAVMGVVANAEPGSDFSDELTQAVDAVIKTLPESDREEAGKRIHAEVRSQQPMLEGNWMRFFLSYDPRPALANIQCPVLAIIGTRDLQVLPDLNVPEIRKALTQGGNSDFEIVQLDDLNHLFQKCETGAVNEYVTIMETFNPEALARIGDWIVQHTTPRE